MGIYNIMFYHVSGCFRKTRRSNQKKNAHNTCPFSCHGYDSLHITVKPRCLRRRLRRGVGIFGVLVRVVDQRQASVGFADLMRYGGRMGSQPTGRQ